MAIGVARMLGRGLRRRCAVCNQGHLFHHWIVMVEVCPGCGLHFQRIAGHWLGSWFLNVTLVQFAILGVLVVGVAVTFPNPPMGLLAGICGVVAVVVPQLFFPISRTLWTAIDLAMRPLTFDEGVPPGFELEEEMDDDERP